MAFFFWSAFKVGHEKLSNFGEDFFSFWRSPDFDKKKTLQSDLRLMKIWVKLVYCCFRLSNSLQNPDYAPSWGHPLPAYFEALIARRNFEQFPIFLLIIYISM